MSKDLEDPRRDFLVRALSLGLFATGQVAGLLQASHARGDVPNVLPEGRSIFKLEGEVTVDGLRANLNTSIGPSSRVTTGPASSIIFVVNQDAFILRGNSELELGSSNNLLIEGMRILSGRILSVFGKREKPHTITTSTATIGIRGTGIYVESDPERSYVCTCYGQTRISANKDPNVSQDITATRHDEPVYILQQAGGSGLIVPGPIINHTDTELALIEELVGRTPPFLDAGGGYTVPRNY